MWIFSESLCNWMFLMRFKHFERCLENIEPFLCACQDQKYKSGTDCLVHIHSIPYKRNVGYQVKISFA